MNDLAVAQVSELKKFGSNLQKSLQAIAAPCPKVAFESMLIGMSCKKYDNKFDRPVAMIAVVGQYQALDKVKFGRWDELATVMTENTAALNRLVDADVLEQHCKCTAELCLAKAAPRTGRSCRPPAELGESLSKLASVFATEDYLPPGDAKDFRDLLKALAKVSDETFEETQKTHTILEGLTEVLVADTSVLFPLVQLSAFKELRRMCLKDTKTRMEDLTKSRTLTVVQHELSKVTANDVRGKDTALLDALRRAGCVFSRKIPCG